MENVPSDINKIIIGYLDESSQLNYRATSKNNCSDTNSIILINKVNKITQISKQKLSVTNIPFRYTIRHLYNMTHNTFIRYYNG